MSGAGASARDRHPSARGRADHLVGLAGRLAPALAVAGPHRAVAVAARAVRGRDGRTVAGYAAAYGVSEQAVAAVEDGQVSVDGLPAPLRLLTPMVHVATRVAAEVDTSGWGRVRH